MFQQIKNQLKKVWLAYMTAKDRRRRSALGIGDGTLPPELWSAGVNDAGHLTIGGVDAVLLADEFGTPLYVCHRERLLDDYREFIGCFRRHYPHVEVDYSYKTNPLPGALRVLHEDGAGAEVISPFELWLALSMGVPTGQITFNGPAKTDGGIETAVRKGIRLINVDNVDEVATIQKYAEKHSRVQPVGVRVTTSVGWSSQFGLTIRGGAAREAFEKAMNAPSLDACALHVHLGTGITEPGMYDQAIREVLEFAAQLKKDCAAKFRYFDFGGGFGVPTVRKYSESDYRLIANGYSPTVVDVNSAPPISAYAERIGALMNEFWPESDGERPTVLFEPGRAISSRAQSLLLRVLAVKPNPAGHFNVILDGGLNVAQPTSFEIHEALPASRMHDEISARVNLCGPLCHPADVLGWQRKLPTLQAGDVVAIMDAGAYLIPNQMHFSNPKAAAVLVDDGQATLVRGREDFSGVVRLDKPLFELD